MSTEYKIQAKTPTYAIRFMCLVGMSALLVAWFTERQGVLYATGPNTGGAPNQSREACEHIPCFFAISVDCEGRIVTLMGSADDGSGFEVDFREVPK